jgi:hypothetical protein
MPPTNDAVNNVWGQSTLGHRVFITLPSGQTCWAKPIGLQGVMESGLLGEADSLTSFVGKQYVRKVRGAKGIPDGEEIDPKLLMRDPEAIKKIVKMVDGVTPLVVVEPVVRCHYRVINPGTPDEDTQMIPDGEREAGVIYTDRIGLEDKMHLFNFAMSGVKEAESFRAQSQNVMGDVADGEGISVQAQPVDGNRSNRRTRPQRRRGN